MRECNKYKVLMHGQKEIVLVLGVQEWRSVLFILWGYCLVNGGSYYNVYKLGYCGDTIFHLLCVVVRSGIEKCHSVFCSAVVEEATKTCTTNDVDSLIMNANWGSATTHASKMKENAARTTSVFGHGSSCPSVYWYHIVHVFDIVIICVVQPMLQSMSAEINVKLPIDISHNVDLSSSDMHAFHRNGDAGQIV